VFNSGVLAAPAPGATYDYQDAPGALISRALRLQEICARAGVPLRAAAARFPLTHPAVASVLIGARSAAEITDAVTLCGLDIPAELWHSLATANEPWERFVALTDEAIDKIKQMILSGRVRPGEKLPREADLAAELGLSRNSLREAVKALSLINVLDVRQGDGTYATSLAPSLLLEALSFIVDFHRDDTVLEFLEVRRILEPAATGLAALRMTDEDKAELGKILDVVTVNSPVEDFVATDLEFHKRIAQGSGNSVLASLVDNMSLPTARARVWRGMTEPRALERTMNEHRAIHKAITNKDADLACSWAMVHIAGIEDWLHTALAG
jgi:GntR family transcriptional regulator, transcriptional repressor for pyruvate dehydrogenase complex